MSILKHTIRDTWPNWLQELVGLFFHIPSPWTEHQITCDRGATVYYIRQHCDSGEWQIQSNGPMGDRKWRSVHAPFRHDWERIAFWKAVDYQRRCAPRRPLPNDKFSDADRRSL